MSEPAAPSIRASNAYAAIQSVFLAVFAGVFFWHPGEALFSGEAGDVAGVAICAVGLVIIAAGFFALGSNIQVAPHTKEGSHLVRSGVYRFLRHPIYTGMALCVAGLWLKAPYVSVAIAGIAVIAFLGVKRRVEERFLVEAYPDYVEYRKGTIAWP